jgi:uncharacterized protein DUF4395
MDYNTKGIARRASILGASIIEVTESGASTTAGVGRGTRILGFAYGFIAYLRRATAVGDAVKRNFILQQGFAGPAPEVCPLQYSALVFQPKLVLIGLLAGILFQSQAIFLALGALLWWSALFPKLNPFRALYNRTIGRRAGMFRLRSAPMPRRGAEMMAGTFALTTALLIYGRFIVAAYAVEAVFLAGVLALAMAGFCPGSFVYHLVRGRERFALQTLPWSKSKMNSER